jgi:hypothetical protein
MIALNVDELMGITGSVAPKASGMSRFHQSTTDRHISMKMAFCSLTSGQRI